MKGGTTCATSFNLYHPCTANIAAVSCSSNGLSQAIRSLIWKSRYSCAQNAAMHTRSRCFTTPTPHTPRAICRPARWAGRAGPAAGDAVPVFRHVRAVEAIAAHCWVGSDGTGGAPHHRQTAEDSSLTLSISMQPTPSKTRLAQSSHDRLASTHDVPEQARPAVFDHQNDRPLVDAEVIGANPPSGGTVFDHVGFIERGFEPIKTCHAEVHSPEVSDRRNDDLGRERQ